MYFGSVHYESMGEISLTILICHERAKIS